jgi:hypothetical protein
LAGSLSLPLRSAAAVEIAPFRSHTSSASPDAAEGVHRIHLQDPSAVHQADFPGRGLRQSASAVLHHTPPSPSPQATTLSLPGRFQPPAAAGRPTDAPRATPGSPVARHPTVYLSSEPWDVPAASAGMPPSRDVAGGETAYGRATVGEVDSVVVALEDAPDTPEQELADGVPDVARPGGKGRQAHSSRAEDDFGNFNFTEVQFRFKPNEFR